MKLTKAEQELVDEPITEWKPIYISTPTLKELQEEFLEFAEEIGVPLHEVTLDVNLQYDYSECSLVAKRPPNEKEKQKRLAVIKRARASKSAAEEKKRKQEYEAYLKLKKKFEMNDVLKMLDE